MTGTDLRLPFSGTFCSCRRIARQSLASGQTKVHRRLNATISRSVPHSRRGLASRMRRASACTSTNTAEDCRVPPVPEAILMRVGGRYSLRPTVRRGEALPASALPDWYGDRLFPQVPVYGGGGGAQPISMPLGALRSRLSCRSLTSHCYGTALAQ